MQNDFQPTVFQTTSTTWQKRAKRDLRTISNTLRRKQLWTNSKCRTATVRFKKVRAQEH